ncbi:NAD(P)-dependent oxidoreductase [Mesobaculum littorinae]|uniref:NAD(P)-dependent oxidoreductase n=1 Tax=Mesobaculum littorinae TaxID=2486419 RepID=A0A438AF26_9RHOB|nr:NAD(P)-dependent oxidoreductase [Mesobaculum littorinae]RVV97313.1 NAD(P)-dependent oxidoreductase [Mesobaculum littorinae]
MKVALVGASGNVGSRLLKELSDRGHAVTAIARDPGRIASLPGVTPTAADLADDSFAKALEGHEAVISSLPFSTTDPDRLIGAVQSSGVGRYLVVGGAGSLEVAPGKRVIDQPEFPEAYKPEATAGALFLDKLRAADDLDWTFLSPSAEFVPGERTGDFRLGEDTLLVGETGSRISYEDYAIALVDELETPRHSRRRFTVGY